MKQILQSLANGTVELADVPRPVCKPGHVLVAASHSLISAGTERMLVEFGEAGPLAKARSQPDKVRMVLEKVRTDGLVATLDAVRSKLDQPLALAYCHVGRVLEVGRGVTGFAVGDRVVTNGKHAEVVCVCRRRCARRSRRASATSRRCSRSLRRSVCKVSGWCNQRWANAWW